MSMPRARQAVEARLVAPPLKRKSQLRAAANMLSRAHVDDISATTVVGVLGADDVDQFATSMRGVRRHVGSNNGVIRNERG